MLLNDCLERFESRHGFRRALGGSGVRGFLAPGFDKAQDLWKSAFGSKGGPSATPPPAPPPIVPISDQSRDTVIASKDYAAAQKKRKGLLSTIKAGETNSGTAYNSNFGTRSLLGG